MDEAHKLQSLSDDKLVRIGLRNEVEIIKNEMDLEYPQNVISHPNPLLFGNIIQHLSRYLDFQTLQTARLVNSTWNSAVSKNNLHRAQFVTKNKGVDSWDYWNFKNLFQVFPIKDHESIQLPKTIALESLRVRFRLDRLVLWLKTYGPKFTHMKTNVNIPIIIRKRKCLFSYDADRESKDSRIASENFERLVIQLPNLIDLELKNFEFHWSANEQVFQYLRNLKALNIYLDYREFIVTLQDKYNSLIHLLKVTTNLKCLTINTSNERDLFIPSLRVCQAEGYLTNLVELNLPNTLLRKRTELIEFLTSINFKNLKRLYFATESHGHFDHYDEDGGLLVDVLTNLFNNLKTSLEEFGGGVVYNLITFQRMPKLRKLRGVLCYNTFKDIDSIDFVDKLPALESLELAHAYVSTTKPNVFKDFKSFSLKTLHLSKFTLTSSSFSLLVTCFPALEVLSIRVQSESELYHFFTEFANLKKLIELNLTCCGTARRDHLMFGNPSWHPTILNNCLRQKFPHIMTLRKFTLIGPDVKLRLIQEVFTDGFLKAPSLTHLQLQGFTLEPELDETFEQLENKGIKLKLLNCHIPTTENQIIESIHICPTNDVDLSQCGLFTF